MDDKIYEGCFNNSLCEGKCRELYYDTCPVHQKFYYVTIDGRQRKEYISEKIDLEKK